MYIKTKALVIREVKYKESDKILTLLSPEHGKISAFANRALSKNSKLSAPTQLFAYSEFVLVENKGKYTVNEAACIDFFQPMRGDIAAIALAAYFASVADELSQTDFQTDALLNMCLNCFYAMSTQKKPLEIIKAVFELRAAMLAGYMPDLEAVTPQSTTYFDLENGVLTGQRGLYGRTVEVSPDTVAAMEYILNCPEKRIFAFNLAVEPLKQLARVAEEFLACHLDKPLRTLDFYKKVSMV